MTKFCVGKTYQKNTGRKTKCLAICETSIHGPCILMEDSDFKLWTFHLQDYERGDVVSMREYKEPVVHKATLIWVRYRDGMVVPFPETGEHNYVVGSPYTTGRVVAVQPVSYTEIP
jgi:hypothetical protein